MNRQEDFIWKNVQKQHGVFVNWNGRSPQRQLTLLMQIYSCAKEGAQFIIVTHSPILLGIPDADIYCFDDGRIHLCEYEETESYRVTEMFINNRQMLLDKLLTD